VWVYEKSGGRLYTRAMRMHHLLLYTTGRRSGRAVVACLPYWIDADEHRIVVASMAGGTRNPAWYHNLRDRTANPQVRVRDKRQVFLARAGVLEGQEREAVWRELTQDRPFYLGYQEKCERPIPLVRLVRSRNSPVITTSDANSERPR
jgi:deazaflavin-dependent oxidoreductase (nitroreductase family)